MSVPRNSNYEAAGGRRRKHDPAGRKARTKTVIATTPDRPGESGQEAAEQRAQSVLALRGRKPRSTRTLFSNIERTRKLERQDAAAISRATVERRTAEHGQQTSRAAYDVQLRRRKSIRSVEHGDGFGSGFGNGFGNACANESGRSSRAV